LVGYQTKTFWKVVTSNTILIVPDTPANRRDYQDEVLKTVYLTNPLPPADRTAITTALKQILGLQRIIDNPDSNAIVIRDTPDKVAAAEKLIHDLDRGKAEILIDVAVIEADRDRIRDLGLQQAPGSLLPATGIAGLGFVPRAGVTTTTGGVTTSLPVETLNKLAHISTADFSITVPGALANALLSDSHTHILQNPQVRVTDGLTAKVRIGSRVPFATGSFLPSFGGAVTGTTTTPSIGLLASTQFQYQEVGVNLDITPHLLASGEVSLHALIEVSSVGPSFLIGGLSEPSFQVRKIEHDIRLKESEVNLLGGLIQSNETRTVSGLPGFGDLPFFHYFFSSEHRERVETEVLVMLTPRVIRLPDILQEEARTLSPPGGPTGAVEAFPPPETRPLPNDPQP
jgi:general secretion pathway protein D